MMREFGYHDFCRLPRVLRANTPAKVIFMKRKSKKQPVKPSELVKDAKDNNGKKTENIPPFPKR